MTVAIILFIIYGGLFLVELFLIFSNPFKKTDSIDQNFPRVTVLVCARNEEHNLKRCLNAIVSLDYPKDLMQVLVGDDNSTDETLRLIKSYENQYSFIKAVEIENEKEGLIAKANVLNQLIDLSDDEFQVIIDADMAVSPQWLKTMVGALQQNELISGYTRVDSGVPLSHIQKFDWQVVLHSMKAMADIIRPISILGNNMGFRKSAYNKVGGFRALGPTDVEDLGLLQRFQKAGMKVFQIVDPYGYALTLPQPTWSELMIQRCRWMNGVFTHHWLLAIPAFFARLWVLCLVPAFLTLPLLGWSILLYAYISTLLKYMHMSRQSGEVPKVFFYEPVFISLLDTFALLRILVKGKVSWKGRKF